MKKIQENGFSPTKDDGENYESTKESFATLTKDWNPTISEENKLKLLYSKGLATFGSVKILPNASHLPPKL